jgi:hypothetical protein
VRFNSILEKYQEKIAEKTTPEIAENVIQFLINRENVELVTPYTYNAAALCSILNTFAFKISV